MRAEGRICSNCGARNKPKWEFCVRCGESLADSAPAAAVAAAEAGRASTEGLPWRAWLVTAGVLVAAVGAFYGLRGVRVQRADPSLFVIATPPPASVAPAAPVPDDPVRQKLLEGRRLLAANSAEALPLLAQVAADRPTDPEAHFYYGKALLAVGSVDAALAEMRLASSLTSDRNVRAELARTLEGAGHPNEASQLYAEMLNLAPGDAETLRALAGIRIRAGQHAEAVPLLKRLAEARPQDLTARQDLAFALERSGDVAAAADLYTGIVTSFPRAAIARGRLAEVLAKQGKGEQAMAILRDGISVEPDAPSLHRGLGMLQESAGQYQEAIKSYREYARLAPNNPDAKKASERAQALEKLHPSASSS